MGETRVNLVHLLEDLRDAYPGSLEETIVTEIVANALDSGARTVSLATDATAATLTVADDGKGMTRAAFTRYHDLAATKKRRGRSIGFAGVGIKLALLLSEDVVSESRGKRTHLATSWRLTSRNRAPWRWVELPGMVEPEAPESDERATGTAVRLYLTNALSPLLDRGFLDRVVTDHFAPLLDPAFDEILAGPYPGGVRFRINDRGVPRTVARPDRVHLRVRVGRQRKASGIGYMVNGLASGGPDGGLAVSTMGKVILRGWDWLDVTPSRDLQVSGLIEVPALVEVLQLNKAGFIRTGKKGATFLAYRRAIQEPVAELLAQWGDAPEPTRTRRPRTRTLERDLQSVLADLTGDFPLVATLVDRKPGGQRRLPLGDGAALTGELGDEDLPPDQPSREGPGTGVDGRGLGRDDSEEPSPPDAAPKAPSPGTPEPGGGSGATVGRKRPASYGLKISFESRPDAPVPGRLVESTLWINEAFPAYKRALASRSEGYHVALTVALALAPLVAGPDAGTDFVIRFMGRWGRAAR